MGEALSTPLQRIDRDAEGLGPICVDEFHLVGGDDGAGRVASTLFDQGQRPAVTADHAGAGVGLPDGIAAAVREGDLAGEDPAVLFGDPEGHGRAGIVGVALSVFVACHRAGPVPEKVGGFGRSGGALLRGGRAPADQDGEEEDGRTQGGFLFHGVCMTPGRG